jgi:peptide/nickel transport system substrate-binding protein
MNQAQEPFNNQKIREAVNYAVDPAALERIYTGQIVGTQQILPPGMPGYEKIELFPHDVAKAKELVAESGVKDKEVTVWTDSESPNNDAGTYYQGVLNEIGLKAELKILNPDNYFTVIGNTSTPNLDTGFADWFQDYPHPNDFLFLLNGENIQSTNNQNFGQVNNPTLNKKIDKLATEQLGPQQEKEYAELDEEFMKEGAWAPYGTRTLSLFVSENINLESAIWNPTFETELTSLEFKE